MTVDNTTQSSFDGVILFSGFNQRSVVAMCRTLEACNIEYHIVAHTSLDTMFQTSYASRIALVRKNPQLDIDDLCSCIGALCTNGSKRFVIAPTSEALNLFLLKYRDRIEQTGVVLSLTTEALYRELSDKGTFISCCREYGVSVPEELPQTDLPSLPVVAKPYCETRPDGTRIYPLLIYTEQKWYEFVNGPDRQYYFLQRYIQGPSYYIQYYFHASGEVDRFSMRNLVQQPEGKSVVAAEPADLHLDKAYEVFETLLRDKGFHGLIMVELMFENDQFYVIEANPRMWGPAQLMVDAGKNLYVSFINDLFGTDLPLDICKRTENPLYFWAAGFWGPQLQGEAMKWHVTPNDFWNKFPDLQNSEVYCREDTREVFLLEAQSLPLPTQTVCNP